MKQEMVAPLKWLPESLINMSRLSGLVLDSEVVEFSLLCEPTYSHRY